MVIKTDLFSLVSEKVENFKGYTVVSLTHDDNYVDI